MILCHKHKFIFIKTKKTAGTSLELFLSQFCDDRDIVTPDDEGGVAVEAGRNYRGLFNPIPEIAMGKARGRGLQRVLRGFRDRRRFYGHASASIARTRIPAETWNRYTKFCVERNPWDKTVSHYYYVRKHSKNPDYALDDYFRANIFAINYPLYTDRAGNLLVDRVVRYENLAEELGEIFAGLGIPFDGSLGAQAKGGYREDRRPYQEVFSPEQREIVARVFAPEIALHGYTF